jgi:serine/threonine-protein kinase
MSDQRRPPMDLPSTRAPDSCPAEGATKTSPDPSGSNATPEVATVHPPAAADPSGFGRNPPSIPGYELLTKLAPGGMGVVYEARQMRLNRTVALKVLRAAEFAGDADLVRFRVEAEAVARLDHPNVVRIHDFGEHNGLPYYSMECVEGGTLADKLAGRPLPPCGAAQLVEVLARAVHYVHQRQIIHRDLKPTNILLTADGTLKVADFGLAKLLDEDARLTHTRTVLGTASYMAPEQAAGKAREAGPAADIYALGAILYEALTGRPPFRAETRELTIVQVLSSEPVPPGRVQAGVPPALQRVCLKCLHKEPGRRYASAEELADDLRRCLQGQPIAAQSADSWECEALQGLGTPANGGANRARPAYAHRIGAAAVLLALLGLGGYAWHVYYGRDEQGEPSSGVARAAPSETPKKPVQANDPQFPRRALAVCVSNYWHAGPVAYGEKSRSVGAIFRELCDALNVPKDQRVELSDGGTPRVATTKPVLKGTVTAFLDTCRTQDRILLLFVGHAAEIGNEAYLVPIDGDLDRPDTLIPLKWLYDGLARCRARQKVLILDVCRYDPAGGLERPGNGPMGPVLDAALQSPPAGVQVWSACSAGQYSYEGPTAVEGGGPLASGIFLSEVYAAVAGPPAKRVRVTVQTPNDSMAIEDLATGRESVQGVNRATAAQVSEWLKLQRQAYMKLLAALKPKDRKALPGLGEWLKLQQTPRLSGLEGEGGAAYNPREPQPSPPALMRPAAPGDGVAPWQVVEAILREVGENKVREDDLPPFQAEVLAPYQADGPMTPLRKAVLRARDLIARHAEILHEEFRGDDDNAIKAQIFRQQRPVAKPMAELQDAQDDLNALEKDLGKERSRRWKANYEWVRAYVQQRMAYLYEYDYLLGSIRKEPLPKRDPAKFGGWRLAAQPRAQSGSQSWEPAQAAKKMFLKIAQAYKGTPWESLARRAAAINPGLRWELAP